MSNKIVLKYRGPSPNTPEEAGPENSEWWMRSQRPREGRALLVVSLLNTGWDHVKCRKKNETSSDMISSPNMYIVRLIDHNSMPEVIMRLRVWPETSEIELYDLKKRKRTSGLVMIQLYLVFLKKCECPNVDPDTIRVGSRISIMARLFEIVSCCDESTKAQSETSSKYSALMIILPSEYYRVGSIIRSIQKTGVLRVTEMRMLKLNELQAAGLCPGFEKDSALKGLTSDVTTVARLDGEVDREQVGTVVDRTIVGNSTSGTILIEVSSMTENFKGLFSGIFQKSPQTAIMNFCSLLIVKPHAFHAHAGAILETLLKEDFEISAFETRIFNPTFIEEFLEGYKLAVGEHFRESVLELCTGQSLIVQVRHANVVDKLRRLCGPIDPEIARSVCPDSLRARFGIDTVRNAVYCTDLKEDAIHDCMQMFN